MANPNPNQTIDQISVEEFAQLWAESPADLQLVDVREPSELDLAEIKGFQNLPLSQYADWAEKIHSLLDADKTTCVICHHGMRSAQMCQWLMSQGFTNVKNIAGGIDAYSLIVDPSVPRY